MTKTAHARRVAGMRFDITTGSGHRLAIDDAAGDSAPRPAELLLAAQAGCTALDVVSILAKKRQTVEAYEVAVTGEQREDVHPHVFRRIDIVHRLEGSDLDATAVARAIELSATRYCTANAMFSAGPAEVHHRFVISHGNGDGIEAGEVVVTGPGEDPDSLGQRWAQRASAASLRAAG